MRLSFLLDHQRHVHSAAVAVINGAAAYAGAFDFLSDFHEKAIVSAGLAAVSFFTVQVCGVVWRRLTKRKREDE